MREASDEALMQAFAGGDMHAFEVLYQRHRGPLYRYLYRQVGDEATANDLFQGSWEKMIRARAQYRPAAPFGAWMYRIARNHMIDHLRSRNPGAELHEENIESPDPRPQEALMNAEKKRALEEAIRALPPEQRDALLLKLEAGLSLAEIARASGVSEETAKSRLRYAVAKLKRSVRLSAEETIADET